MKVNFAVMLMLGMTLDSHQVNAIQFEQPPRETLAQSNNDPVMKWHKLP